MNTPTMDIQDLQHTTANAHQQTTCPQAQEHLNELFEELANPMSFWQELRITAMSGTDYVFIPRFVYEAFGSSYPMTRFMTELSCAFSLDPSRVQIVCIDDQQQPASYSKVILEWSAGSVGHHHLQRVAQQASYNDYLHAMFQASSSAVGGTDH